VTDRVKVVGQIVDLAVNDGIEPRVALRLGLELAVTPDERSLLVVLHLGKESGRVPVLVVKFAAGVGLSASRGVDGG
jgi:hypothetical protein